MKSGRFIALALGIMILFLQSAIASAQTGPRFKADIPFSFVIGKHTLPAGTYVVSKLDPHIIALGNEENWIASLTNPNRNERADNTRALIFHKIGHKHFLAEVWLESNNGLNIPQSAQEREDLKAANSKPNTVTVALR